MRCAAERVPTRRGDPISHATVRPRSGAGVHRGPRGARGRGAASPTSSEVTGSRDDGCRVKTPSTPGVPAGISPAEPAGRRAPPSAGWGSTRSTSSSGPSTRSSGGGTGDHLRRAHRADRHRRPTLVRAAPKSFADVLPSSTLRTTRRVLEDSTRGRTGSRLPLRPSPEGVPPHAEYDTTIAAALEGGPITVCERFTGLRGSDTRPRSPDRQRTEAGGCRYGENPPQRRRCTPPARPGVGLSGGRLLQARRLSFTNLPRPRRGRPSHADVEEPAAVVVNTESVRRGKTGERCAMPTSGARRGSASAFRRIGGLNRPLDADTAEAIASRSYASGRPRRADDDACRGAGAKKNSPRHRAFARGAAERADRM